eukprot:CAMPEP_0171405592 /NCGR_PEP_ID=MMETSP0880-20121228/16154_1 /TAXON_ID=67004 /ORGANISM="Thalassiosira weissflogii, Strain CCMP1336" /LENGTH=56 /DNA_ID=CAMNT_0011921083 /DNA_START=56 /DNA_END=226 /DNA_ORIENTATION=-
MTCPFTTTALQVNTSFKRIATYPRSSAFMAVKTSSPIGPSGAKSVWGSRCVTADLR